MTPVDIRAVLALLDPEGKGGRRHADEVATAVRDLAPHVEAAVVPELVRDTILHGDQLGFWSAARTTTVRRGRITLPKTVLLRSPSLPADRLCPVDVPLRDELASWATGLPLSAAQRDLLLAVNDWLRRTDGGDVPVVAAAERAYELIRDEKAFDSTSPRGGAKLWGPGQAHVQAPTVRTRPHPSDMGTRHESSRRPWAGHLRRESSRRMDRGLRAAQPGCHNHRCRRRG